MRVSTQEINQEGSLGFHQRGEGQKGTFSRVLPKRKHQPNDNVTKALHKTKVGSHLIRRRNQNLSSASFLPSKKPSQTNVIPARDTLSLKQTKSQEGEQRG